MDIRALKYFVAAYEEQSLSGAAKRSFVAQPSISQAISDLEGRMGVSLFMRHARGVTPTHEGRALYEVALKVISDVAAIDGMFKTPKPARQSLSVALMPSVDGARLRQVLGAFAAFSDTVQLRLVELGDDADIRLVSSRMLAKNESFRPLWKDDYILALPSGHPLSLKRNVVLEDLNDLAFVERCSCEALTEVVAALERKKIAPDIVAQAKSEDWAAAMVASGVGAAFLPREIAVQHKDIILTQLSNFTLSRTVGIAHHRGGRLPKGLLRAIETSCADQRKAA